MATGGPRIETSLTCRKRLGEVERNNPPHPQPPADPQQTAAGRPKEVTTEVAAETAAEENIEAQKAAKPKPNQNQNRT